MSGKRLLLLCAILSISGLLEAASLHAPVKNADAVAQKLDIKSVEETSERKARQSYTENDSDEDSDEDDDEEDAEQQHDSAVKDQQTYEQTQDDSQEGSDEDDIEDIFDDDLSEYFGRRLRRDISNAVSNNEIEEISKPSLSFYNKNKHPAAETSINNTPTVSHLDTSNTSVLILIRDAIKKVTEIPNTQQVTTSAQQYFQLFQHFLQQTIEQVIGDDDEDEVQSTTVISEAEKETASNTPQSSDKPVEAMGTSDKDNSVEHEVPKPAKELQNDIMGNLKL